MFEISRVLHQPITMASPNRNNYSYQGIESYDSGRSRQNSDAMDIHVITAQEPPREPPDNNDPYDGHGGPDGTSHYSKYFSLLILCTPRTPQNPFFSCRANITLISTTTGRLIQGTFFSVLRLI